MTNKDRTLESRIENLELNKETVQDLTEEQADNAQGGLRARGDSGNCDTVVYTCPPPVQ